MADTVAHDPPLVRFVPRLTPAEVAAVGHLAERATDADGVRPLSEHVMLHLRHGGDDLGRSVIISLSTGLVAYGHLDLSDPVAGASAEVVVHPDHRRQGYGRLLVEAMAAEAPGGRLRLWAHGELPTAAALAVRMGFARSRVLWQMRRSLYAALPEPVLPPGISLRTFQPGLDDHAWVELNRVAFVSHPEQGRWTAADLRLRMHETWFDPGGFFLAEREGLLVGFHWTKVHGDEAGHRALPAHDHAHAHERGTAHQHAHAHRPIGEVYVVGVDPAEHGRGLGRALTVIGLRHLRQRGLPDAMLYVEADNAAAVRLYTRLGFTRWETDVMFSR